MERRERNTEEAMEASTGLAIAEGNWPGVLRYKWLSLAMQQTISGDEALRALVFERARGY